MSKFAFVTFRSFIRSSSSSNLILFHLLKKLYLLYLHNFYFKLIFLLCFWFREPYDYQDNTHHKQNLWHCLFIAEFYGWHNEGLSSNVWPLSLFQFLNFDINSNLDYRIHSMEFFSTENSFFLLFFFIISFCVHKLISRNELKNINIFFKMKRMETWSS